MSSRFACGLGHLRLVRADLCVLSGDLRVNVAYAGFPAAHLGLRLRERDAVWALVDLSDHGAFVDVFVVGDRNRGDVAADLGRDRELPRRDERIVGRLEMRGVIPVEVPRDRRQRQRDQPGRRDERMPAEPALARALAWLFALRVRLRAGIGLSLGRPRRALGLSVGLRRALSRRLGLRRRRKQGNDVPLGAG